MTLENNTFEITVEYDEELLRKAVFAFWRRYVLTRAITTVVGFLLVLGLCIITGSKELFAVLILGTACVLAIWYWLYRTILNRTLNTFRQLKDRRATWRFGETTFSVKTDLGNSELAWRVISEVWRYECAWLIFVGAKQNWITLPCACLTEEMRKFILDKITAAGGKVR